MNQELTNIQAGEPNAEYAEDKLLSCCLNDAESYDSVQQRLNPDDFYTLRGRLAFEAIGKIADENKPIDEIALAEELKKSGGLDEIGGMAGILAISEHGHSSLQRDYYCDLIAEKARLRRLIRTCKVALEDAHSGEMDYIDISSKLESGLDQNGKPTDETKISNSIESIREEIRCIQSGEYVPDVVRTHTGRLDSYLGNNGIGAGEVFVLAAPTSCGKSALALFMALQANRKDGVPVAIFSIEMPQKQLSVRLTQTLSGLSYRGIKDGSATESQVQKFDSTMTSLAEADIYTSHTVKNVEDLISQCRRFVKAHKVKLIVIDYLQLIPFWVNRNGTKAEAIANISHKIKQMALNLNVSVILLAQVNREGAKREGGLSLYDLKDSGDIENDADIVTLMFPTKGDIEASKDVDPNGVPYTHMFTKIAKNREGERDILDSIKFFHTVGRFDI